MIRAVTFDWWNTIAQVSPDFDGGMRDLRLRGVARALADHGVRIDEGRLGDAYDRHTEYLAGRWKALRDPHPDEQIASFLAFAGLDAGDPRLTADVAEAFGGAIRQSPPLLYPSVGVTLAHLKGRGVRIGIVSNTGRTWGRYLRPLQEALGIGPYFDVRIFSDEIGRRKPDPRIFEAALRGLGLRPEEVAHIGDDLEADVGGAKRIGMRAVWFHPQPGADGSAAAADATVRDHTDLPGILEAWSA